MTDAAGQTSADSARRPLSLIEGQRADRELHARRYGVTAAQLAAIGQLFEGSWSGMAGSDLTDATLTAVLLRDKLAGLAAAHSECTEQGCHTCIYIGEMLTITVVWDGRRATRGDDL